MIPASTRRRPSDRAHELLSLVGIPGDRHKAYPYEYSGGMRQRAGIAMALSGRPALLIADEPVTALDVIVQARILRLLENLREALDLTILFITHDLGVVARLCDRVVVLYAARAVEEGTVEEIYGHPKHPYTRALLESVPNFARGRGKVQGDSRNPAVSGEPAFRLPLPPPVPRGHGDLRHPVPRMDAVPRQAGGDLPPVRRGGFLECLSPPTVRPSSRSAS